MNDLERLQVEYAERERRLKAHPEVYSPFNPAHLFMLHGRQRAMFRKLRAAGFYPLEGRPILEVGCGAGGVLLELLEGGASPEHLHAVDLLPYRLAQAVQRLPEVTRRQVVCADGQDLPYASGSFDLVLQFTVFSSLLDEQVRRRLAGEMLRVLRPWGAVLWYDFWWNPVNRQTRGIGPAEMKQLFPGCRLEVERVTLAPPLARLLAPRLPALALLLERLRLFNSHYLGLIFPGDA